MSVYVSVRLEACGIRAERLSATVTRVQWCGRRYVQAGGKRSTA